jgi:hypothetical protein
MFAPDDRLLEDFRKKRSSHRVADLVWRDIRKLRLRRTTDDGFLDRFIPIGGFDTADREIDAVVRPVRNGDPTRAASAAGYDEMDGVDPAADAARLADGREFGLSQFVIYEYHNPVMQRVLQATNA